MSTQNMQIDCLQSLVIPEQLPNEKDEYYNLFMEYVQERSIDKLYLRHNKNKKYSISYIKKIASNNKWKQRIAKYNQDIAKISLIKHTEDLIDTKIGNMENLLNANKKLQESFMCMIEFYSPSYIEINLREIENKEDKLDMMNKILRVYERYINTIKKFNNELKEYGIEPCVTGEEYSDLDFLEEFSEKIEQIEQSKIEEEINNQNEEKIQKEINNKIINNIILEEINNKNMQHSNYEEKYLKNFVDCSKEDGFIKHKGASPLAGIHLY